MAFIEFSGFSEHTPNCNKQAVCQTVCRLDLNQLSFVLRNAKDKYISVEY